MHIKAHEIRKTFGERPILDGLNLEVSSGETVVIIGPSGSGKSTFLRCLNGLQSIDSGSIQVGDHKLEASNDKRFSPFSSEIRKVQGMIFQDFNLFPHMSVLGNVAEAPAKVLKQNQVDARNLGMELLKKVGLESHANHFPSQLSGGQKQRVAIARALAMKPKVLLCDEVTSSLDPELKHEVLDVLEKLKGEGMTLLMVTHEIGFAKKAADKVVFFAGGKVVEEGSPQEILESPENQRIRTFISKLMS
ncbi:MAG: amino acid ABC transporter ATP-binding protein [Planctomycetes bacterium]|nr:amino acid ABC transporter ATP-binding protein [Planctomycetota bacterium]NBY02746.1 amino acid ABC transporter ATP-binding protein [Planctomycetota bacterium]